MEYTELFNEQIAEAWDSNIQKRALDLETQTDTTYNTIIKPWVLQNSQKYISKNKKILDVGCGCGYLTNEIYQLGGKLVLGIDISSKSIDYAKKRYPLIDFQYEDFYNISKNEYYDLCFAIMTVNNMPNIYDFFIKAYDVLCDEGILFLVIPHPIYWPAKHIPKQDFTYFVKSGYKINFSTKGEKNYSSPIIYFHRPIEDYINAISSAGFSFEGFQEIIETANDHFPDLIGMILSKKRLKKNL